MRKAGEDVSQRDDVLLDSPVKSIQRQHTKLGIVAAISTTTEEEFSQLRDVLAEKGDFLTV